MEAPLPANEVARLKTLCSYNILDTPAETAFDDLTRLAAQICQVPIALVSLIDECRQWFKSHYGIDATETPRELAFCGHAILRPSETLIVPNATEDERFANNALVTGDPHIRFYAGTPLVNPEGYPLGTLCVIDQVPRQLTSEQMQALEALGRQVTAQLELKRKVAQLESSVKERNQVQAQLESFFDLSLDLLCVADFQGYFQRLNPAFEKVLGYTQGELKSQSFLKLVHPDDQTATVAQIQKLAEGKLIVDFENRYQTKSGDYTWLSWRATPTDTGLIYATAREVTERKQAEQERLELIQREQSARHKVTTILESITDAFFSVDTDWRFTYINRQAEVLLQRNRNQLLGKSFWEEFPDSVGSVFDQQYHYAMAEHTSVEFETYYPPLKSWFAIHAYPANHSGLSVYFEEINERKAAEAQLQETLTRQRAILDSANYSIIATSQDGTILTFNAAAQKWLGYAEDDVVGEKTPALIHDPQEVLQRAQELSQELGEPIEPGFEVFVAKPRRGETEEREWTYIRKDGSRFPVLLSVTAIRDSAGEIVEFLGIASDITEQKQTRAKLATQMRQQSAVAKLGQKALAGIDVQELIEVAVALVAEGLGVEDVEVLELLPDQEHLKLRAGVGWEPGLVGQVILDIAKESQLDYTLKSNQPVVIEDFRCDQRFQELSWLRDHGVISGISITIPGQSLPYGTLSAHTTHQRTFSEFDIQFLQTAANLLATAIEQRRTEESLRESEERWQLALRGNNDGIWDWNLKTNEVFFSSRWKEMLGYEDHEITNKIEEWLKRVHPDDLDWVKEVIQAHFAKKTPFYISEHRLRCKDGSYKWILDRGQALWDEEGNVVRMSGSHTDINERKQTEEELKRQSLRSRLFAEISLKIRQSLNIEDILQTAVAEVQEILHTDRVIIFQLLPDTSGKIVQESVVPGYPVILGESIIDPCFKQGYLERYRQGRVGAIPNIYEMDETQACYIQMLQRFEVKANLVVPILQQEKLWGLLIAHSCEKPRIWTKFETELLRQLGDQIGIALAQAELLERETRQRQELAASNTELQQFAYVASHDLQEPLRKIQAFSDRVTSKYSNILPEQGQDYLARMQSAASRMQTLINDLLNLSRVTTKAQPFVVTDLKEIAQEVLSDLEIRIQQTQGQVLLEDLPTLEADPVQIRQLFQNLISNALKFHRDDVPPQITVASQINETTLPNSCQIVVQDNGIGFEEKYLDRIFNAFQRLHGRSQYEGTGMGLAICRKIVERHGGSITAQSQPGQGSKFMITLPIRQSNLSGN
jgi:PAS domain S-box-containing protein